MSCNRKLMIVGSARVIAYTKRHALTTFAARCIVGVWYALMLT